MTLDRKRYAKELDKIQNAAPVPIEISPLNAVAVINHVQLAAQYTGNHESTKIAISGARELQKALAPESATYQVLELGWTAIED